jgi:integrase
MARKSMGMPAGVELVGQSIRIRFTWNGQRRCETLAYPQTPKGIKAAADLRDNVISLAKHGVLDEKRYAELFPNSSYSLLTTELTFAQYAQVWIDSLDIVPGTRRNYKGTINLYWMPELATVPMMAITPMRLKKIIGETQWESTTTKRTAISRLSAIFRAAVRDEVIERNPATVIQLPVRTKKAIEPFTVAEADAIIEWMYANFTTRTTQIYAAYFEFALYTGMRTGELMALRWDEVDLDKRVAHVCRIVVDGGVEERTKTKYTRTVMLNSRAMHALGRAKRIAEARLHQRRRKRQSSPYVFPPSGSSEHILGPTTPGGHFTKALEALEMKPRSQYNSRHTFATMCLMSGMHPAFIAEQLGHSVEVLLSRYARWLSSTNDWTEVGKLESRIGTKLVQH